MTEKMEGSSLTAYSRKDEDLHELGACTRNMKLHLECDDSIPIELLKTIMYLRNWSL